MKDPEIKEYIIMYSSYAPWLKEERRFFKFGTFKGKTEREAIQEWQAYIDVIEFGKYFAIDNVYGYIDSNGVLHER